MTDIRPCFNKMGGKTDSSKLYSDLYTCTMVHMFLNWLTHITETIKIQKNILNFVILNLDSSCHMNKPWLP